MPSQQGKDTPPPAGADSLKGKRRRFVEEYLVDCNATQAAIRAGYSPKTAYSAGPRLLADVVIAAAVAERQKAVVEEAGVNARQVIEELAKLALSDIRQCFDAQGRLLPVRDMPDGIAAALASVEVTSSAVPGSDPVEIEHTSKLKLWNKVDALQALGRHFKLFTDVVEVRGSLADRLKKARERNGRG